MKKTVFILILILGLAAGIFCQNSGLTVVPGPMDLVMLLDTSASMSNSYRETSDYLTGPFLREFLRIGDTFHLISFSQAPRLEISRKIEGIGDVEAVIGRLLLMYPLDPESNISSALSFAESYTSSLPGSRPRKIVFVSDGDAQGTDNSVTNAANRLRSMNIDLQYIKVPVSGTGPSSGRLPANTALTTQSPVAQAPSTQTQAPPASQTPVTQTPAAQTPPVQTPATQTQTPQTQTPPVQTPPSSPEPSGTAAPQAQQPASSAPASSTAPAAQTPPSQPGSALAPPPAPAQTVPATPASPAQTPPQHTGTESPGALFPADIPLPLLIGLILLALLILGLLIILIAKRLHSSPNRAMAYAASPGDNKTLMSSYAEDQRKQARPPLEYPPKEHKPLPKDKAYSEEEYAAVSNGDPVMLNLFVEDQNTAIGRRNIHVVKPGYSFSVGGGKSDFLIFLVPIPPHIADVSYDGRNCTLIPRRPEYFPDIGSQPVYACIGKNIRVISDKKYELFIRMERYQDPLKALNRMLHSITVPGEVK